jgi:hypothetical protein
MHSLKLRRSGIACAIPRRAAPMGLKKVLFGLGYYKHVAPTELTETPTSFEHCGSVGAARGVEIRAFYAATSDVPEAAPLANDTPWEPGAIRWSA